MNIYYMGVAANLGINILGALSVYIIMRSGQISVGNAGFMAVGAYCSAILSSNYGLPIPAAILLGGALAALSGLVIGVPALRAISWSFLGAGFCIVTGSVFQSLGKGMLSLINSLIRQLGILLPVAYLFSLTGNLNLIWLSFPIAEISSVFLNAMFLRRIYRKVIEPIGQATK